MQILRTIEAVREACRAARKNGSLGFVPTMGALHEGHLSLVRRALGENDVVAASIFVNPLQFAPNEDLAKYPRTFEDDCKKFEREGVAVLFAPTPEEMYPRSSGSMSETMVDPGLIATRLDGASRPGHFIGVATVVAKLLHIVQPDRAYFGQKDAAQLAVLRQMVRDLDFAVEVVACPIVRDKDGLALSSRNRYLSVEERERALILPQALSAIADGIQKGVRTSEVLSRQMDLLRGAETDFKLEYLVFVDPDTLLDVPEAVPGTLVAIAAKVGDTRLIDNFIVPLE